MTLKKELSFLDVFSIAAGAMISSGIFILPGLAFAYTGPSVFVSYFLAGLLALTGILSVSELATAMPRAGGDYYFITRSFGPLIGTISGFLSWFALSLKSAFAIFGIVEVIHLVTGIHVVFLWVMICLIFVVLNILGVKEAAKFEIFLVVWLLALMGGFVILGISHMKILHFEPFAPKGGNTIFSTAGFVFVSFGGLLKVASVSEEVKNPKRNIPLGLVTAVIVVTLLYMFMLIVTVGVLPSGTLSKSLTPIADAARNFSGNSGYIAITIAALLAFITTANAGIMSASRYPLALSRDHLLPKCISRVHKRFQTPIISTIITGGFIMAALLLPLEMLVKAASTVILTTYVLSNISILILRESRIQNYQPSFRAPFYPWLQVMGTFLFTFLIIDMGYATIEISISLVLIGLLIYVVYGRKKTPPEYALLYVLERLTNKRLTSSNLEAELRDILHQRDEIIHDQFDELIKVAPVVDIEGPLERDEFFAIIASRLADEIHLKPGKMRNLLKIHTLLKEREQESSTAMTPYVAIPHIVIEGQRIFKTLIARCQQGIHFSDTYPAIKAVFVIIGTKDKRDFHLKSLAAIAQIVQGKNFEERWLRAKNEYRLRDILLLSERKRS